MALFLIKRIWGLCVCVLFAQEFNTFPLLMRAISYVTHQEAMIRVAVQTIILNVYRGICLYDLFIVYVCVYLFMYSFDVFIW